MKKLLLVVAVVAICGVFQNVKAQFSVGVGLNYATDLGSIGISAQAAYDFTEEWAATADFTYYLEKDNMKWTTVDLNANYSFTDLGNTGKLYGIAGMSYLNCSIDYDFDIPNGGGDHPDFPDFPEPGSDIPGVDDVLNNLKDAAEDSSSKIGVNLGLGLKMDLSEKMLLCPELLYSSAYSGHFRFGAKLMFKL